MSGATIAKRKTPEVAKFKLHLELLLLPMPRLTLTTDTCATVLYPWRGAAYLIHLVPLPYVFRAYPAHAAQHRQ